MNRGDIIGNINFNVDKYIAGLRGVDIDAISAEIKEQQKTLNDYRSVLTISNYIIQNNLSPNKYTELASNEVLDEDEASRDLVMIKSKIKNLKRKISNLQSNISENRSFINIIENYKFYVLANNGEEIPVCAENIRGFNDNSTLLNTQLQLMSIELKKYEKVYAHLRQSTKTDPEVLDIGNIEEYKSFIDRKLSNMNIHHETVESIIKQTSKNISTLKNKIKKETDIVDVINAEMYACAEILGVEQHIEKNGIFTSKVQNKTGAVMYKIIIAFKIAFIKAMFDCKGIKLPLIIDSLKNTELTQKNANEILQLIKERLEGFQVIIASVYDYDNFFDEIIEINGQVINVLRENL